MIVKNEEQRLADCLVSAKEDVDEIVIVDTGSTDGTVEIAASCGAQVFHFPWRDDFAAARNESLRHATGDWVLWLDADEKLNPCGVANCLRVAARNPQVDAYLVPIRNFFDNVAAGDHHATRFFKRYPEIAFSGKVHESVEAFLTKVGAVNGYAQFVIDHFGYSLDSELMRQKLERNLQLLRKEVESDPKDAFKLYYLGMTLLSLGAEEEGFSFLTKASKGKNLTPNLAALIQNRITIKHQARAEHDAAIAGAKRSLRVVPRQNTARMHLGTAYYNQKKFAEALPHLKSVYDFISSPPELRLTEISQEQMVDRAQILKALAVCRVQTGQSALAIPLLQDCLRMAPNDSEGLSFLGLAYVNCGNYSDGLLHLEQALSLGAPKQPIRVALAYALLRTGDLRRCRQEVGDWEPETWVSQEAKDLLTELTGAHFKIDASHELCHFLDTLFRRLPSCFRIGYLLGLAHIQTKDYAAAVAAFKALQRLQPGNAELAKKLEAIRREQARQLSYPPRPPGLPT
ncbi:MAG: glycosyltransferase, partial [Desulforhabdus sp.]|nr:glycosyltransferase [Desulforhabdus sp.]